MSATRTNALLSQACPVSVGCHPDVDVEHLPAKPRSKRAEIRRERLRLIEFPSNVPAAKPVVTAETELLILRHRNGARRMAHGLLRKWKCRLERDELYSLVDLALCEAAGRFDASVGATFTTFFFYHLRGVLVKAIVYRSNSRFLRIEDYERPLAHHFNPGSYHAADVYGAKEGWLSPSQMPLHQWSEEPVEIDEMIFRKQIARKFVTVCKRMRGAEREVMTRLFVEHQEIQQLVDEMGFSRGHIFRLRSRGLSKVRSAVERPSLGRLHS